jgi:hypothetical protein
MKIVSKIVSVLLRYEVLSYLVRNLVMATVNFAGVEGEVIETSPHGSYVVVKLSDRITIVGTTNNQFNWEEMRMLLQDLNLSSRT